MPLGQALEGEYYKDGMNHGKVRDPDGLPGKNEHSKISKLENGETLWVFPLEIVILGDLPVI